MMLHSRRAGGEFVGDGLGAAGVARVAEPQLHVMGIEAAQHLRHGRIGPGDHGVEGAVKDGDVNVINPLHGGKHVVLGCLDGLDGHPRYLLQELCPSHDQREGVGQTEHPGHMSGGYRSQRVTDESLWDHAVLAQQRGEGDLDREAPGLGEWKALEEGLVTPKCGAKVLPEDRAGNLRDLVDRGGERWEASRQLTSHAETMGSGPVEYKSGTAESRSRGDHHVAQHGGEFRRRGGCSDDVVRERWARHREDLCDVGHGGFAAFEEVGDPFGLFLRGSRALSGDHDWADVSDRGHGSEPPSE